MSRPSGRGSVAPWRGAGHGERIRLAIAAHGAWKERIRAVIETGRCDGFSPEVVELDSYCDLGQWIYAETPQRSSHPATIKRLHAEFHKVAARAVALALQGRVSEAERLLLADGDFTRASSALTAALLKWMNEPG